MKCRFIVLVWWLVQVFGLQSQECILVPPLGHAEMVRSITVSTDGKYVLTGGGSDRLAMVWDSAGHLLLVMRGHKGVVRDAAFSPDGTHWITMDGAIRLWEKTGLKATDFPEAYVFTSATFTPDSKHIIAGKQNGELIELTLKGDISQQYAGGKRGVTDVVCYRTRIITADSAGVIRVYKSGGALESEWRAHQTGPVAITVSPDGKRLLTGGHDNKAVLWNFAGNRISSFGPFEGVVSDVAFSPDGNRFALAIKSVGGQPIRDHDLFVYDALKAIQTNARKIHDFGLNAVCFSADSRQILVGGNDKAALGFDEAGKLISIFGKGPGPVRYVSFSPDGLYVLSGSNGRSSRRWALNSRDVIPLNTSDVGYGTPVAFLDGGNSIVQCAYGDSILIRDLEGAPTGACIKPTRGNNWAVAASPVGKAFATSDFDPRSERKGSFQLWEMGQTKPVRDVKAHRNYVFGLAFSPDGQYVATAAEPPFIDSVKLWDAQGNFVRNLGIGSGKVTFSADGQRVGATTNNSSFRVWRLDGAELPVAQTTPLEDIGKTTCLAFSPDGKNMLTGYSDGNLRLWRIDNHQLLTVFKGHSGRVLDVQYSPDGRFVISGSEDNTARIWNAADGKELLSLISVGESGWVAITPDGLFDASQDAISGLYFATGLERIGLELLKNRYYEPGLVSKVMGLVEGGVRDVTRPKEEALFPLIQSAVIEGDKLQVRLEERKGGIGKVMLMLNGNIKLDDNINPKAKSSFEADLTPYAAFLIPDSVNQLSIRTFNQDGWFKSEPYALPYRPTGAAGKGGPEPELTSLRSQRTQDLERINLYALVVGTSTYSKEQLHLKYPDKDAAAFARALELAGKPLFSENMEIKLLTTSAEPWPRREQIKQALLDFAEKSDPSDVILVYFSGHGITYPPNSEKGRFHYLTTDVEDTNLEDEFVRNTKTVSFDSLQSWIGQSPARKRILILDACNSGSVVDQLTEGEKTLGHDQIRALQQMQDETGLFVLSGSAANKSSYEATRFGHGLLTYSLINSMPQVAAGDKDNLVQVYDLFDKAQKEVPRLAKEIGKEQKPELLGRGNYPIGMVNDTVKISMPSPLPVFVRSNIVDSRKKRDALGIGKAVNRELDRIAAEKNPALAYWDVEDTSGDHYFIGGDYTGDAASPQGEIVVYKNADEVARFPFGNPPGDAAPVDIAQIAAYIVEQVFLNVK